MYSKCHRKCQLKSHPNSWFSAVYTVATAHRNHFFCLYQHINLTNLKNLIKASNCRERVLEAAKLAYAKKCLHMLSLPRNMALGSFGKLLMVFLTQVDTGKSAILSIIFHGPEVLSSASDKQTCLLKTFLKTLILMTQVSFYLLSLLELV